MSDVAARRSANRIKVASGLGDNMPPPGLEGREILALSKGNQGCGKGDVDLPGGWRSYDDTNDYLFDHEGGAGE